MVAAATMTPGVTATNATRVTGVTAATAINGKALVTGTTGKAAMVIGITGKAALRAITAESPTGCRSGDSMLKSR
jgi:hypothetical protein